MSRLQVKSQTPEETVTATDDKLGCRSTTACWLCCGNCLHIRTPCDILVPQLAPVKPALHAQWKLVLLEGVQEPPFWHGLEEQGSVSAKRRNSVSMHHMHCRSALLAVFTLACPHPFVTAVVMHATYLCHSSRR